MTMNRKKFMLAAMASACLHFMQAQQQFWNSLPGGNVINAGEYLGAAANSTVPLRFSTIPNLRQEWRTNNVLRMQLMETLTNQTIGTYNNLNLSGHLGLGAFGGNVAQPFSMLHLNFGGTQFSGYRPWQGSGMTITQGSDLGWIGLKNEGFDLNHMTLAWADNTVGDGPDLFKIIFLAKPGTTGTAGNLNGLEALRIRPHPSGNQSFLGIGDWFTAGLNPTERVDLLDGRLRIRDLPDDPETDQAYLVMVVDDTNDPNERGVVKWKDINLNSGCEWVMQSPEPHVSNTYDGSNCSWDRSHGVGIGLQYPKTKLHVYHTSAELLTPTAILGDARFDYWNPQEVIGVSGLARPTNSVGSILGMQARGVVGRAINSRSSIGVLGLGSTCEATAGDASAVIGVMGVATACERSAFVAGLYGEGSGANNPANEWAAYVNGRGYIANGPWQSSDEQLKTDIQDAAAVDGSSGIDVLLDLPVHTYQYNVDGFPFMHLPTGQQMGFIAQELESLIPQAVTSMTHPAQMDSLGNEVSPAVDFKAINPIALIPYLVLTVQRQQARLDQLQGQLSTCCAGIPVDADQRNLMDQTAPSPAADRSMSIDPNPFDWQTMIRYKLDRSGRMQLMANSADGKQLRVLHEASLEAGQYQFEWNTADLAPGLYYVTLLLDGEPIVKKAVKVAH